MSKAQRQAVIEFGKTTQAILNSWTKQQDAKKWFSDDYIRKAMNQAFIQLNKQKAA